MKRGRTQKLSDTQRKFSEFRAAPFGSRAEDFECPVCAGSEPDCDWCAGLNDLSAKIEVKDA